jgi:hypothetical protein
MYRPFRPTAISGHTRLTSGHTTHLRPQKTETYHAIQFIGKSEVSKVFGDEFVPDYSRFTAFAGRLEEHGRWTGSKIINLSLIPRAVIRVCEIKYWQ